MNGLIARNAYYAEVTFDFVVPAALNWSIGVVYHENSSLENGSGAVIYRIDGEGAAVENRTRQSGIEVSSDYEVLSVVDYGIFPGSTVSFELLVNDAGAFVRIDGDDLVHVPSEGLRPGALPMQICVGFIFGEFETYEIEVRNLRAVWVESPNTSDVIPTRNADEIRRHEPTPAPTFPGGSIVPRNFVIQTEVDDSLDCPFEGAFAFNAYHGNVAFDFIVPDVSDWSVGVRYHDPLIRNEDSMAYVSRQFDEFILAEHWTRADGVFISESSELVFDPFSRISPGMTVQFQTIFDRQGSRIFVNGDLVLHVPIEELRPQSAWLMVCAGLLGNENQAYLVPIRNLNATWTSSPYGVLRDLVLSPTPTR